jgi:hypothetical protein
MYHFCSDSCSLMQVAVDIGFAVVASTSFGVLVTRRSKLQTLRCEFYD